MKIIVSLKQFIAGLVLSITMSLSPAISSNIADTVPARSIGIASTVDISYTGINASLGAAYKLNKFRIYLGVKKNINKSYVPSTSPFGLVTNLSYFPNSSKKISGFLNADYQAGFWKIICPSGNCDAKYNLIQEYSFGYGFQYRLYKDISLLNNINIGRYRESLYSELLGERIVFTGYNILFRIGLNYEFN